MAPVQPFRVRSVLGPTRSGAASKGFAVETYPAIPAGYKPARKRPHFLQPETERALAITMALVQELAVTRQRLDTLERTLQAKGVLVDGEINSYAPDATAAAERALWSQE